MLQYNLVCLHSRLKIPQSKSLTKNISNHPPLLYSPLLTFSFGSFTGPTTRVWFLSQSPSYIPYNNAYRAWNKLLGQGYNLFSPSPGSTPPPSTRTQRDPGNTRKGWRKGPDPFLLELSQHWHICQQTTTTLSAPDLLLTSPCLTPENKPRKQQDSCPQHFLTRNEHHKNDIKINWVILFLTVLRERYHEWKNHLFIGRKQKAISGVCFL